MNLSAASWHASGFLKNQSDTRRTETNPTRNLNGKIKNKFNWAVWCDCPARAHCHQTTRDPVFKNGPWWPAKELFQKNPKSSSTRCPPQPSQTSLLPPRNMPDNLIHHLFKLSVMVVCSVYDPNPHPHGSVWFCSFRSAAEIRIPNTDSICGCESGSSYEICIANTIINTMQ